MKIQVLSDLHNEFLVTQKNCCELNCELEQECDKRKEIAHSYDIPWRGGMIKQTDAEIIVLAGDINTGVRGIEWAVIESIAHDKPILYVMGNHEYYGHAYPHLLKKARKLIDGTNVHLLENDEYVIDDTRFLGCTLWTDYDLLGESMKRIALELMRWESNDYKKIRVSPKFHKLRPLDTVAWHRQSRLWLKEKLSNLFEGQTIVISHMAPSIKSCNPSVPTDESSCAYASNLDSMMDGIQVKLWIHGHTHVCNDYVINGTRIVSNPKGYYGYELVEQFDPCFVVSV